MFEIKFNFAFVTICPFFFTLENFNYVFIVSMPMTHVDSINVAQENTMVHFPKLNKEHVDVEDNFWNEMFNMFDMELLETKVILD